MPRWMTCWQASVSRSDFSYDDIARMMILMINGVRCLKQRTQARRSLIWRWLHGSLPPFHGRRIPLAIGYTGQREIS
ncbi:hypothetical protein KCP73_11680 [Salmonella enterica subsp. enterica]|nr:hypothetical protein KCP73_11680 [Salmonella enterica subsp. enterica]